MILAPMPLSVDFWYRSADDGGTLREFPQMTMGALNDADVLREISSLRMQGYTVQRVVVHTVCATCTGTGSIRVPPKGTRLKNIASLPDWRFVHRPCAPCDGKGFTASRDYPLET